MNRHDTFRLIGGLVLSLAATTVLAQQRPTLATPEWGTTGLSVYTVGAFAFQPFDPTAVYASTNYLDRLILSGNSCWVAPVTLPSGTVVDHLELVGCDNSEDLGVDLAAWWTSSYNGGGTVSDYLVTTTGAPGCGVFPSDSHYYRIDNSLAIFVLQVCTPGAGSTNFRGVRVWYHLTVSDPPNIASFLDVPSINPYYQFVEALAAAGITAGCGGGNYCPDNPVTRGQLAVILAKALGLYWPN